MKVKETNVKPIPVLGRSGKEMYEGFIHTILFETDAGFYQVMRAGFDGRKLTEEHKQLLYAHGQSVSVKEAVELFGSAIAEKMDWSDPE